MQKLSFLFFSFIFCVTNLFSAIVDAPSLEVIVPYLSQLDKDALVVWDVDYTLIVPKDAVLTPVGEEFITKFQLENADKKDLVEDRITRAVSTRKIQLVDDRVLTLLQQLKTRSTKTMALTAMRSGPYGVIPNTEEWRVQELCELGIDFSHSFPHGRKIVFDEFKGKKSPPVFFQGVLTSDNYSKGEVLAAFLKRINFTPSKIVFIDDRLQYIQQMEKQFEGTIPTLSFHYTAVANQRRNFDPELAEFQLNTLVEHGLWLGDDEARCRLQAIPHGKILAPAL